MIKTSIKALLITIPFFLSMLLSSCGGGGITVADGGISGTGITQGRITNFGSIIVNGVTFDVDSASFLRDGAPASGQEEYSVGEYVVIKGSIDTNGTSGIADEVTFSNEIEGAVSSIDLVNNSIEVLGQTIVVDQLTVFINFNALSDLFIGNIIEVSGLRDVNDNTAATSIKLKSTSFISGQSELELKGTVSALDTSAKTFMINTITIEYENAVLEGFTQQGIANGQFVEVESSSNIVANVLLADEIELEQGEDLEDGTEVNIEGQVTRFESITDFDVNGLAVTTNSGTEYSDGIITDLALGVYIDLEGETDNNGVIVAESISFEESDEELEELEGFIESIDVNSNEILLSGQVILVDASTIMVDESDLEVSPLTINDLNINDKLEIKGTYLADGKFLASKLERKEIEESED